MSNNITRHSIYSFSSQNSFRSVDNRHYLHLVSKWLMTLVDDFTRLSQTHYSYQCHAILNGSSMSYAHKLENNKSLRVDTRHGKLYFPNTISSTFIGVELYNSDGG